MLLTNSVKIKKRQPLELLRSCFPVKVRGYLLRKPLNQGSTISQISLEGGYPRTRQLARHRNQLSKHEQSFCLLPYSGGGSGQMYNGGGQGNIVLTNKDTKATITNSTIVNSGGWGIHKGYESTYTISITQSNNTFANNALGNVSP